MSNNIVEAIIKKAVQKGVDILLDGDKLILRVLKQVNVDNDLISLISEHKEEIKHFLGNVASSADAKARSRKISLRTKDSTSKWPLSFAQERLWFVHLLQGSVQYHMPYLFKLKGQLQVDQLAAAFKRILTRHEVLRTLIREGDGNGYQEVRESGDWKMTIADSNDVMNEHPSLQEYIDHLIKRPFDLSHDYMLRVELIRLPAEEYILVVVVHHIASDGWSMGLMLQELKQYYNAPPLEVLAAPETPVLQYADYAVWQREYLSTAIIQQQAGFWEQHLKDLSPLELSSDFKRPVVQDLKGAVIRKVLDNEMYQSLLDISRKNDCTLFVTLLSAFKVLLMRNTGDTDIYVGSVVSGRQLREVEQLVGFFINTLVLRDQLNPEMSFTQLMQQVKLTTLQAYEHQDIPFDKVVQMLGGEREMNRHPVFQYFFAVHHSAGNENLVLHDIVSEMMEHHLHTSIYDFSLDVLELSDGWHLQLTYASSLFRQDTMERLLNHYIGLLQSVIKDAEKCIAEMEMLSVEEQHSLLHTFNDTQVVYPEEDTLIDLFSRQVKLHPEAVAVVCKDRKYSYSELDLCSTQLSGYLVKCGVKPGEKIPVCFDRSFNMLVALLGVMKAGAAYVPVDPAYPLSHIDYLVGDIAAAIVVTTAAYRSFFQQGGLSKIVLLDQEWEHIMNGEVSAPQHYAVPDHLAYIIYTSGSTGRPKGVMITHQSLINFLRAMVAQLEFSAAHSILAITTYSFDISCLELYTPLIAGGKIYLAEREDVIDGNKLHTLLAQWRPTHMQATPSTWQMLLESGWQNEENVTLLTGGEALPVALKKRLTDISRSIWNMYGPTETTIWSTAALLDSEAVISIGRPISNTAIYILNSHLQLCPVGAPGQLCIAGAGVARGYLHQEQLTAEKFISNPFGGGLLYQTGDIARWQSDGSIVYIGRADNQLKIKGHRIEPGEIEMALSHVPGVKNAVVVAGADRGAGRQLIGYVVTDETYRKEVAYDYLVSHLPAYMVPSTLSVIDDIPLTANGKVDRKALSAMATVIPDASVYEAPRNPTEEKLVTIWEALLNISPVGIHDNFFELGGHSLLAMRVVAAVRKQLDRELAVRDIFLYTSIAQLGAVLSNTAAKSGLALRAYPREGMAVPLSFAQERLWFLDQLHGSAAYHMPFVFRIEGELVVSLLENALRQIIDRHEVLRTVIDNQDGQGYQRVLPSSDWQLEYLADLPASTAGYVSAFIHRPFDLSSDYPLRVCLLKVSPTEHILAGVLHHICSDGWSIPVLTAELAAFYSSTPATLPALPLQYADYAWWQQDYLQTAHYTTGLDYWQKQLSGLVPFRLTGDQWMAAGNREGAALSYQLNHALSTSLVQLCHREGCTMYMLLLSAFKVLLYRYSGIGDIAIGTSSAGRRYQELEGLIGFFINTLVLRSHLNGEQSFKELLQQVRETTLAAYDYADIPFEKIVETSGVQRDRSSNPLYEILFTMQNNEAGKGLTLEGLTVVPLPQVVSGAQFDINFNVREADGHLMLEVIYRSDLYSNALMQRFVGHYERLLESIVADADQRIGQLHMLTTADEQLQISFNNSSFDPSLDTTVFVTEQDTVIDVFLRRAQMHPDASALVYSGGTLTYAELALRSRTLANTLRSYGVGAGTPVLLCTRRGADMMTGILGILMAGGAYVPLEPDAPAGRQEYIITDSGSKVIVTTSNEAPLFPYYNCICVDGLTPEPAAAMPLPQPADAAYIIYTSGSTGKPKGVKITHSNLRNYIAHSIAAYIGNGTDEKNTGSGSYVHLSYSFDAAVTALFAPLLAGRRVVMGSNTGLTVFEDPLFLSAAPYDFIKLTPAHLPLLTPVLISEIPLLTRRLVVGGEALQPAHYEALGGYRIEIINEYGPTEATVGCSTYHFNTSDNNIGTGPGGVLIGRPIRNMQLYVLDQDGNVCPAGVRGELCISGAGLSAGYHHQPEQTQHKFITNPFGPGLLYRTGDVAQLEADGNLSYLGRLDDQVKIRGYRIEPGEVEVVLSSSPGVQQAAVVVDKTEKGFRLSAFIVKEDDYNREAVEQYLRMHLPEYMLPAQLTEIAVLPLTVNGKVDRSALAAIAAAAPAGKTYEGARNEMEAVLVTIWEELLDISPVGIHDNFFELGGDSIVTIQLVSRARRQGYHFEVADVFSYQDIAALSIYIAQQGKAALKGEQGILSGSSGLLPVQQWYLANNGKNKHISHFNQCILLRIAKSVSADTLHRAADLLSARHDALGFRYRQTTAGEWEQTYSGGSDAFVTADLRHIEMASLSAAITRHSQQYQESLDITAGPIFRLVLLLTPAAEEHHRLLLVVHHLAVDSVSWRILLEELDAILTALQEGNRYEPLSKTSAYREWYQALSRHTFSSQLPYWERISAGYKPLHAESEPVRHGDMAHYAAHFSTAQTRYLLQEAPRLYQTEINDLLLYALCCSLKSCNGHARVHIGLEGHGREALPGTDLSRTVGWFTSMYPVMLEATHDNIRDNLLSIKEQLRQIPGKGIGYGVLKYIHGAAGLSGKDPWDLVFNYLGQSDNVIRQSNWLSAAPESAGQSVNNGIYSHALIAVNSLVSGGSLQMNWTYSPAHYNESDIATLSEAYFAALDELMAHCREQGSNDIAYAIPSDYGLSADVSYEALNSFLSDIEAGVVRRTLLSGVYRLSPLQEGLLFHGLYNESGGAYIEQFRCEVSALDEAIFIRSWEQLLSRHSILRSSFYAAAFNIPVQGVHRQCELPLHKLDYRGKGEEELQALIAAYLEADRQAGFDFRQAPLMRFTLIRLDDSRTEMIWTFHHLILDGWSTPVLMEEFLQTYEQLISGVTMPVLQEDRYEDYIRYIAAQDKDASVAYWKDYLKNITEGCLLPYVKEGVNRTKGTGRYQEQTILLDAARMEEIASFCRYHRITVNTLIQGVWSYLLHRYTGSQHITYGVTVSGRPGDLADMENRVGMYTNTLPFTIGLQEEQRITDWLLLLQQAFLESQQYQYSSLTSIQQLTGIGGDLFDTMITFQNYPVTEILKASHWNFKADKFHITEETSNYPLSLRILLADTITIQFIYKEESIDAVYVENIAAHFEHVLDQCLDSSIHHLKEIKLLTAKEETAVLQTFNYTKADYGQPATIVSVFNQQVQATPDAVALVFLEEVMDYRELNKRVNQLAHYLVKKGVQKEMPVPLCLERGPGLIIGMLAVLKAGGAYVALDPAYPQERLSYMLEDTAATLILTDSKNDDKLLQHTGILIDIDSEADIIAMMPVTDPVITATPYSLAYIVYTSGSTGRSKGVMIEHHSVVNLVYNQVIPLNLQAGISVLQFASISFDAAYHEIFTTLLHGGKLVLVTKEVILDSHLLNEVIRQHEVALITLPPSYQSAIINEVSGLKTIISAGEALNPQLAAALTEKGIRVINAYGPSENTVSAILSVSPIYEDGTVTIGKPLANVQAYILDGQLRPMPVGLTGELYLGGTQLARGYLHAAALTREKFINNPWGEGRLYRTGDMAKWLPDGNMTYVGRKDEQVKIRGYRIEPGEIEQVLQECPGVKQAAVVVVMGKDEEKRLAGYLIKGSGYTRSSVDAWLNSHLPEFMIPSLLREIEEMPLTPNGKIDKKLLASWRDERDVLTGEEELLNTTEAALANIWKELLDINPIRRDDNFFELGGHSLLAIRLISAIRKKFDCEIDIRYVFDYPTIGGLAEVLAVTQEHTVLPGIEKRPENLVTIPLSFSQERLWFIDQLQGSTAYLISNVLRLKGHLNKSALSAAFREILSRHEILRTVICEQDGKGYQFIRDAADWNLEQLPYENGILEKLLNIPFSISDDYMLKAWLINVTANEYLLVVGLHHIAADGWSMSLLTNELNELYNSAVAGRLARLPVLPVQYADYALWQRDFMESPVMATQLAYWKEQLKNVTPFEIPADFTLPAERSMKGGVVKCMIDNTLLDALTELSEQEGTTLFMTLLAVFNVLLYRYTGHEDICVGSPVAGRNQLETEKLIGLFVNTIVLRTQVSGTLRFTDLLQAIKQTTLEGYTHQHVPFEKVVDVLGIQRDLHRHPLYQVLFTLQHQEKEGDLQLKELEVTVEDIPADKVKHDLSMDITLSADGLQVTMDYSGERYRTEKITRMLRHFEQLLLSVVSNPAADIASLILLPEEEKNCLLHTFNNTSVDYGDTGTILLLLEEQVRTVPDSPAVSYAGEKITYRELDRRAAQLAVYLQQQGVGKDVLVPVCTERGIGLIVCILGVLKAGGAYVPLDPAYPAERLAFMLEDTAAGIVLADNVGVSTMPYRENVRVINIETAQEIFSNVVVNGPQIYPAVNDLAYVIYTSGSTGRPKGVMIEHGGVLNMVRSHIDFLSLRPGSSILQFASSSFDGSCQEIFNTLCSGSCLVIPSREQILHPELLFDLIVKENVALATLPPSYQTTVRDKLSVLETLYSAGEALNPDIVKYIQEKGVRVINGYGPTENTVTVTLTDNPLTTEGNVIIGKPINNVQVYIVDRHGALCPVGIAGEIMAGGAQVARGYLNLPLLTAEKFIPHPFGEGRVYRTGDLGRWLPDGNIEYLGRLDEQLKIRGFRIEPGEVESALLAYPGVKQAVAVAGKDGANAARLLTYVVTDEQYHANGVMSYLQQRLPAYMVPSFVIILPEIPLTPSGKADKRLLSQIEPVIRHTRDYEPPRNEVEKILAAIWEELLGLAEIGIYDNFFELGGDSIITIQVVSRSRRKDIVLQPRDLFIHQDIASLSAYLAHRGQVQATEGEQGVLSGNCGLLPVQQWYLTNNGNNEHISHFNQSVLLRISKAVSADTLQRATDMLAARHDALRFHYRQAATGEWEQAYGGRSDAFATTDLQHIGAASLSDAITRSSQHYQKSLDIKTGHIFRMALLLMPAAEEHHRLLLVVHHLAVDGVSWRILLEDLDAMLTALQGEHPYEPLPKTSAYREWYQALSRHTFSSQLPHWERISAGYKPLRGEKEGTVCRADMEEQVIHFSAAQTKYLLQEAPRVYQTEVNDLLLYALCRSLTSWSGHALVHIGLEGHGREALPGTDLSRTVGWFTSMYPVMLETPHDNARDNLLSIKEQLRQIPGKGIGYGVLKYIHGAAGLSGKDPWDLVFNYLGQSDNVIQKSNWLSAAEESAGRSVSDGIYGNALMEVNSIVSGGCLQMNWSYNRAYYNEAEIAALSSAYFACIEELIAHCREQENNEIIYAIPADYGLSGDVSYEELNSFLSGMEGAVTRRTLLSGLYRLSPLQEGLLFHGLYDESGGAYIEQFRCEIGALEEMVFIRSWEHLLHQHSILRSSFYADAFNIPVQGVHRKCEIPLHKLDYRGKPEADQQALIAAYLQSDRETGFDFRQAPLMRFTLIRLDESRHEMIWTFHHLILDGWSTPVLMEEFLQTYEQLLSGAVLPVTAEDHYGDYIRYIADQDQEAATAHWKAYLDGVTEGCLLPYIQEGINRTKGGGSYREETLLLGVKETEEIASFCRHHRLTVNTLIQGVWSYLLHRYTGSNHITYGITVSGRPDDLSDVERRIGLYINTLPFHTEIKEEGILDWLFSIQKEQLESRRYQYRPLSELQQLTGVNGDLFDTMITFQNYPVSESFAAFQHTLEIGKITIREQSNYPLSIVVGTGERLSVRLNYNETVLPVYYVRQMLGHIENGLLQIARNAAGNISGITLLTPVEEQLIHSFSHSLVDFPKQQTMIDLFAEQVLKKPDAIAVVFEGRELSYAALNQYTDWLGHYLRAKGVKQESLVPVSVNRSMEMIIAMLGVMKAGGVFVPVDSSLPQDRLGYILKDTACHICIADTRLKETLLSFTQEIEVICLSEELDRIPENSDILPCNYSNPAAGMYVIYTSGSTGRPKGVLIEHHALVDHVFGVIAGASLDTCRSFALFASLVADAGHSILFSAFALGGTVHVLSENILLDADGVREYLEKNAIDCLKIVPTLWLSYLENSQPVLPLKVIIFGGETFPAHMTALLSASAYKGAVYNHYGPTEITIGRTIYKVDLEEERKIIPIGSPFGNTSVYVLDEQMRKCPVGIAGELHVGGNGIARGYLNQPEITAARFTRDIFSEDTTARFYKTGDLVKWLPDGNLEYIARKDAQVKLAGNRIEPGEIEMVLQEIAGVKQALVVVNEAKTGDKRLVGYIVVEDDFDMDAADRHLKSRMPAYMIPSFLIKLDSVPLLSSGKVNRKALPDVDVSQLVTDNYVAPETTAEKILADIWRELLKIERVGVQDNFFELGGNSLLVMRMSARIKKRLSVSVPVHLFFQLTRIRDIAKYLELDVQALAPDKNSTQYEVINI
ncbi:MAG: non-ribosomal peptide synthase/polyketide synthase [Chitinophaga sp.]|uniref:non-ribosomal peptide synthetase n=1 Tax=Chitinophaga sp. TaxID=1869181 RepID=UPI001B106AC1|nr:non-ribosomal peptide synthase/polyketide synthase [Chitinophaga sp.]MBO9730363.1 non-ribosomal peptide synthase/polyketide synthase [Chitinophaga sp.]